MSDATASERLSKPLSLPTWAVMTLSVFVIAAMPVLLVLINARLLMTDAYLRFAYNSPVVPADPYGFTREDRLELAPLALGYLFNDAGIEYLGDQTFPNGAPLYNERELKHMLDVKIVTQNLVRFGFGLLGVTVLCAGVLAAHSREAFLRALRNGSIATIAVITLGLFAVATSFNWLFTEFHNLFFEEGTWVFYYSDTLIRLFPIEFWILAFALMFGGALLQALVIGGGAWWGLRRIASG
jgi:integral membrane protein (TIGR01906 family)